jgi:hypothetical protein
MIVNLAAQDVFEESSYQQHPLGALGIDKYGNKYRYVQNGGSALTTGNLLQEPAEDTNFRSMVVNTNAAIGATEIEVTLGGSATTANMFEDGHIFIESSTGIGQQFRIIRHDVQSTTTGTCTFVIDRPLKIALVASTSQASVRKNAYDGVIQCPVTTQTGRPVGVALYAMTASYYGWIGTGGDFAVLFDAGDNTANDTQAITISVGTAGCAEGDNAQAQIGICREVASTDSTMNAVFLYLD